MSLSGSLLVFTDEMKFAQEGKWIKTVNANGAYSYDASFQNIRRQYPGWEGLTYEQPGKNEAVVYLLRKNGKEKKVFAHPTTGAILHVAHGAENQFHRQLLLWHYSFYAGTPGKVTVFIVGCLFVISLVTGFFVYRKSIWKVLSFKVKLNRRSKKAFYSSAHRIVGVWSLVFTALIVITGLFISWKVTSKALKSPPKVKAVAAQNVRIDDAKALVEGQFSNFETHLILVSSDYNSVKLLGRYKDDPFYYGKYYSNFTVNASTAQIEKKQVLADMPLFDRLQSISSPLHFGNYGGLPLKIIYCLLGLTPGVLSVTGYLLWLQNRKKKSGNHLRTQNKLQKVGA
jgi:uncharacterized iron-regulated membrane protein